MLVFSFTRSNLSAPKLMITVVMLVMIQAAFSPIWRHALCLLAVGHFTCALWITPPSIGASGAWGCWAVWGDTGLGFSCISPGTDPDECTIDSKMCIIVVVLTKLTGSFCIFQFYSFVSVRDKAVT